jgi:hypothetical protein
MSSPSPKNWRTQFTPWRAAGTKTEGGGTADDVVRETGWVFNNETGKSLTLADFVRTGDDEVRRFMKHFRVHKPLRAGDRDGCGCRIPRALPPNDCAPRTT